MLDQEFEGCTRALPVTYPASPLSGQMCRIGNGICGVAAGNKDSSGMTVVDFSSEKYYNLSVTADSGPIAIGDSLYFHDANGINNTASGGVYCGNGIDALASGTGTVRVVLPGAGAPIQNSMIQMQAVSVSAAKVIFIGKMPGKGTVVGASIISDTVITASDTNNWIFTITDKGQAGVGNTSIATKSTAATGGVSLAAYVEMPLVLSGIPANLVVQANDIVVLAVTLVGAPTTIATLQAILKVQ